MPGKKVVKKAVSKKVAKKTKVVLPDTLPVGPTVPELREALICVVDEPRRWAKTGLAMSALPRYANAAAIQCGGKKCFFCGAEQQPIAPEKLLMFHPEYPLCACLMKYRKVAFDYIPNWDSAEGRKMIMQQADAGLLPMTAEVYQYFCTCGVGPIVVDVRAIVSGMRKYQKHARRRQCFDCHQKSLTRWQAQEKKNAAPPIQQPKNGPGAKFNKIKKSKPEQAAVNDSIIPPLPPLEALELKVASETSAT